MRIKRASSLLMKAAPHVSRKTILFFFSFTSVTPRRRLKRVPVGQQAAECSDTENDDEPRVLMVNDVARAFFEAPVRRAVCVELPPEQREEGKDEYFRISSRPVIFIITLSSFVYSCVMSVSGNSNCI